MFEMMFCGLPVLVVLFFAISLTGYISAKRKNKKQPGTFTPEEVKWRKTLLIVASVVMAVFLTVVIGFIVLLATAVSLM